MSANDFIKKIIQSEDFKKFKQEMYENGNVTANVDGYQTPNAFAKSEEDFEDHNKETAEVYGYKLVPKKSKQNFESVYKQAMNVINEGTYNEFRKDETRS